MSAAGGRIAAGVGFNQIGQHAQERNQEATVYIGNLDPQVTEELVWELMVQAGPVVNVYMPKDRVTGSHQGYGFVEFRGEEDAEYAVKIMNMIKLHGKPIRVNKSAADRKTLDVGANLFIGNLDPELDEKMLYDTFSAFGVIVNTPKIMRDPDTGNSKGFGFVSYDSFEGSDAALEAMNGQYLCNRQITVTYAYKKDTRGERHGTPAERLLAAQNAAERKNISRPHTLFAAAPSAPPPPLSGPPAGMPPPPQMYGGPPGPPPAQYQPPPGMPPPQMPPPQPPRPPVMPPAPAPFPSGPPQQPGPPPGYFPPMGGPPGMPAPPPGYGGPPHMGMGGPPGMPPGMPPAMPPGMPPGMPPPPFMAGPPGMPMPPPGQQYRPPMGMPLPPR